MKETKEQLLQELETWKDNKYIVKKVKIKLAELENEKDTKKPKKKEDINLDLNGDGVFDEKDKSIAGKVLASETKKKKSKSKK